MDDSSEERATRDIGLVLGGGGSRGFAHVGVLRALEETDLRVSAIAGCSMGAIVGAFHAAGYDADTLLELAHEATPARFLSFGDRGGVIGGGGIAGFLEEHLPERFEDLSIPFLVNAVDLKRGELVVLREGPLVPALRATSAMPGLLSPARIGDRVLIDGGVLDNLPLDALHSATLDPVVAVEVAPPPDRPIDLGDDDAWWERIANSWRNDQHALVIEVLLKASELTQNLNTRMRLAIHPPEVLIRPDLPANLGIEDFARLDEAVEAGYRSAVAALRESSLVPSEPGGADETNGTAWIVEDA